MVPSTGRMRAGFRSGILGIALLLIVVTFLGLSDASASTHFIAANGSDSNPGTSNTTPWAHAPGMPNCSGSCASYNPQPGDRFIFRGGDTWHFGNSSASPSTGGTWDWGNGGWNGTNGNPVYLGVDQTWFSGSSWSRPILNADNPTSTAAVGSCAHQIGSNNVLVDFTSINYLTFDNFELTGMCQNDTNAPFGHDIYVVESNGANNIYEHLYVHGWTHLAFSCSGGSGHCFNFVAFLGSNLDGDLHLQDIVDGSDSDPAGLAVMFGGGYDIEQCIFRWTAQIVTTRTRILKDTLFEHWYEPGDHDAHGNLFEESHSSSATTHAYYNNVFRDICSDSNACPLSIVGIWPQPDVGTTDYFFNNVMYDAPNLGGNYFDIGQNSGAQGTLLIFNNTFEQPENSPVLNFLCSNSHPFIATNNQYIVDGPPYSAGGCQGTYVTENTIPHALAATNGLTATETYAYSPISASGPTVGVGTNRQNYCTALSNAGLSDAAAACQSDTPYACTYNSSNHTASCPARTAVARPTSGAWDVAAFQFNGQAAPPPVPPVPPVPPAPPSNLIGVVH